MYDRIRVSNDNLFFDVFLSFIKKKRSGSTKIS